MVLGLCLTTPLGLVSDIAFHAKYPMVFQIVGAVLVVIGVAIAILEPGKAWLAAEDSSAGDGRVGNP